MSHDSFFSTKKINFGSQIFYSMKPGEIPAALNLFYSIFFYKPLSIPTKCFHSVTFTNKNWKTEKIIFEMKHIIKSKELLSQIFFIRGKKVILDFHLAALYQVETRTLKQQVKRNSERFPADFMFQLSETEWKELITICDNLGGVKFSPATPFAFTEQGVAMLSGILRSKKAVQINIAIMRAFVQMRELIDETKGLKEKLDELEGKYDKQFQIIFDALRKLIHQESKPRISIGFKPVDKE